jgi:hypothetical protein
MMKFIAKGAALTAAVLLTGCNAGGGSPFSNPFGGSQPRVAAPSPQPQLPVVTQQPAAATGGRPSMVINATPKRVQDTIIARAQRRGTTIVGANQTGVTLEAPMANSNSVVETQCGPHKTGRTQRIYLETLPNGSGTTVSEDRFIIDDGSKSCQLTLPQADVEAANKSLADLKQQSEAAPRTASASAPRPADPSGRLEPLNPGRPVVPVR